MDKIFHTHTQNTIFVIIYSPTVVFSYATKGSFLKNLQAAKKGVVYCSIIIKQFYIRKKNPQLVQIV